MVGPPSVARTVLCAEMPVVASGFRQVASGERSNKHPCSPTVPGRLFRTSFHSSSAIAGRVLTQFHRLRDAIAHGPQHDIRKNRFGESFAPLDIQALLVTERRVADGCNRWRRQMSNRLQAIQYPNQTGEFGWSKNLRPELGWNATAPI